MGFTENRAENLAAFSVSVDALAKGGLGGCPRNIECPQNYQNYDPVTCSNGVTYSNACEAFKACATGCTEGGGGS